MSTHTESQLTLDVLPHKDLPPDAVIVGSLKISGEYRVDRDLNAGDRIRVVIQTADGEILDTCEAEVQYATPVPIKVEGTPIGTERKHVAKRVDD
jgi:hypothetical protein